MIDTYQQLIAAEIKRQKFGDHPKSLYEPLRYIMSLSGKRLRPLLTLLAYSLYRDNVRDVVPVAVAVETFHNFTLLHDDIMDNAPLRRGHPTVHEKWNINTAILSGDVMQVKVYDLLLQVPDNHLREVLIAFNRCATEVCEGQQMDMEFESRPRITEAQYLEMIRLKTAVLIGFSLELGGILSGTGENDKKALRDFGVNLGLGFQLKDDLLDVYGDKKKFGKQVGGDIIANKKTFLLITALSRARGRNKESLQRWLNARKFDPLKKIREVTALYDETGVKEIAEKRIAACFDHAFKALENIPGKSDSKSLLRNFASQLLDRQQ